MGLEPVRGGGAEVDEHHLMRHLPQGRPCMGSGTAFLSGDGCCPLARGGGFVCPPRAFRGIGGTEPLSFLREAPTLAKETCQGRTFLCSSAVLTQALVLGRTSLCFVFSFLFGYTPRSGIVKSKGMKLRLLIHTARLFPKGFEEHRYALHWQL